jgi:chromosome segregation ATPase
MIPDQTGQELHDRDTRGIPLTPEELTHLDEWYRQQDAAEGRSLSQSESRERVAALRAQVDQALSQVKTIAQEMQDLARANDQLRRETTGLRQRLAQRTAPEAA